MKNSKETLDDLALLQAKSFFEEKEFHYLIALEVEEAFKHLELDKEDEAYLGKKTNELVGRMSKNNENAGSDKKCHKVQEEIAFAQEELKNLRKRVEALEEHKPNARRKQSASKGPVVALAIALIIAIGIAFAMISVSGLYGAEKIDRSVAVTYDIGNIIGSILLGSGGLIAGIAYAASNMADKDEEE